MSTADIDRELIRDIFIKHGFTIKDGYTDLKPYVYAAADDLIALACFAQTGQATNADVHTLRRLIECAEKLNERPRPLCRDCADENGTCPNSGLECDMRKLFADAKALHNRLVVPASTAATQPDHALTAAVDAAMVEMANISPPLRRSECARLIRAALATPQHSVTEHALNIAIDRLIRAWAPCNANDFDVTQERIAARSELVALAQPIASTAATQPEQASELAIGVSNNDQGVHINIMQRHADGKVTVLHAAKAPAGDSFARVALAIPASTATSAPARLSEEHPNLKVPTDPACSAKLDELGDDRGQGLDPYWKFGFRTGWHHGVLTQRASTAASEKVGALDPLTIKAAIAAIAKRLTNDSIGQYAEPAEDGDDAGKRNYDAGKFGGINDLMREVERWLDANIATPAASEQQAGADELPPMPEPSEVWGRGYNTRDMTIYARAALTHRATTATTDALRLIRDTACFDSTPSGAAYYRMAENALAAIECRDAAAPDIATTAANQQTERKTQHLGEGMARTGYILQDDTGRACIVHHGAVRWLSNTELWNVVHPAADQQASDDARAGVRDAIAEALSNVYYCGRAWSAWGVGTMSEDDFTPAAEVDEVLDGLTDAAIAAMAP